MPRHPGLAPLLVLSFACGSPAAARAAPAPVPKEDPAPAPPAEDPPPPPAKEESAPAPVAEVDPRVRALLAKAAAHQGTAGFVGDKAIARFQVEFGQVLVYSGQGDKYQTSSVEAYAVPREGSKNARLRSAWTADGVKTVLGHSGRAGWLWTEKDGTKIFSDEVGDAADLRDIRQRQRMLGLALRVFFLGNLASGNAAVTLGPEGEGVFPAGEGDRVRKVRTIRLDRAGDPARGEPPIRLHLDAETLDPVAAILPAPSPDEPGYVLTFEYDPEGMKFREKGDVPEGVRVPTRLELFEVREKGPPAVRIQADLTRLIVDPAKIPDATFSPPK